jgi:hypothetical protein
MGPEHIRVVQDYGFYGSTKQYVPISRHPYSTVKKLGEWGRTAFAAFFFCSGLVFEKLPCSYRTASYLELAVRKLYLIRMH